MFIKRDTYLNFNVVTKDIHTPVKSVILGTAEQTIPAGTIMVASGTQGTLKFRMATVADIPAVPTDATAVATPLLGIVKEDVLIPVGATEVDTQALLMMGSVSKLYVKSEPFIAVLGNLEHSLNRCGLYIG